MFSLPCRIKKNSLSHPLLVYTLTKPLKQGEARSRVRTGVSTTKAQIKQALARTFCRRLQTNLRACFQFRDQEATASTDGDCIWVWDISGMRSPEQYFEMTLIWIHSKGLFTKRMTRHFLGKIIFVLCFFLLSFVTWQYTHDAMIITLMFVTNFCCICL